jgi:CO/xanthine dehydrogenase Mo-binding subunit
MNSSAAVANGIGQPVRRREDLRLLTGKGSFADDFELPGLAHAVIVRSPHAHAHIRSIDKAAAVASPGVLALLRSRLYHRWACADSARCRAHGSTRRSHPGSRLRADHDARLPNAVR